MNGSGGSVVFTVVHAVAGLAFVLLAYVALRQGPKKDYLRAWIAVCACAAAYTFLVAITGQVSSEGVALILMRGCMSAGTLSLYLFLIFALTFVGWTRGARVMGIDAHSSTAARNASDHLPVVARVELP